MFLSIFLTKFKIIFLSIFLTIFTEQYSPAKRASQGFSVTYPGSCAFSKAILKRYFAITSLFSIRFFSESFVICSVTPSGDSDFKHPPVRRVILTGEDTSVIFHMIWFIFKCFSFDLAKYRLISILYTEYSQLNV